MSKKAFIYFAFLAIFISAPPEKREREREKFYTYLKINKLEKCSYRDVCQKKFTIQ